VMAAEKRALLIRLETVAQRDDLVRFLHARGCDCRGDAETSVAVEDCDHAAGGLATLVALVEDWRAGSGAGEAMLELGEQRRILRTET
jgi:hypothetical protein